MLLGGLGTRLGNGPSECVALEIHRLRQRVATRIWSSYQDHVNARTQYADPSTDTRRQHTRDAIRTLEEREQAAQLAVQKHTNQLYMHRQGRPSTLGVQASGGGPRARAHAGPYSFFNPTPLRSNAGRLARPRGAASKNSPLDLGCLGVAQEISNQQNDCEQHASPSCLSCSWSSRAPAAQLAEHLHGLSIDLHVSRTDMSGM